MRRILLLCAGWLALGLTGCETNNVENVIVMEEEPEANAGDAEVSPIVGTWNVSLAGTAATPDQSTEDVIKLNEELKAAVKEVTGEDNVADAKLFNFLKLAAEFRADGTCSMIADNVHQDGTWTLDGDQLIETYGNTPGKPAILTWDGPDKFSLLRADGVTLTFVRDKR